jgi:serine/threonine-protein kinase RsbW
MSAVFQEPCNSDSFGHLHTLYSAREVVPIVERIASAMADLGYREQDIFGTRLVLEEAIVNGLKHGNRFDPSKRVTVRFSIDVDHVLVQVEDEGPGFDPLAVPDPTDLENLERPSGRGIFLIKCYSSWVRYNDRGNCVTLCKRPSVPLRITG